MFFQNAGHIPGLLMNLIDFVLDLLQVVHDLLVAGSVRGNDTCKSEHGICCTESRPSRGEQAPDRSGRCIAETADNLLHLLDVILCHIPAGRLLRVLSKGTKPAGIQLSCDICHTVSGKDDAAVTGVVFLFLFRNRNRDLIRADLIF